MESKPEDSLSLPPTTPRRNIDQGTRARFEQAALLHLRPGADGRESWEITEATRRAGRARQTGLVPRLSGGLSRKSSAQRDAGSRHIHDALRGEHGRIGIAAGFDD